jgi:hypothetical protein
MFPFQVTPEPAIGVSSGTPELLGALVLGVLLAFCAALALLGRRTERHGERVFCPLYLRPARVVFRTKPGGERVDVIRCSVFGRRPLTCGKGCLA